MKKVVIGLILLLCSFSLAQTTENEPTYSMTLESYEVKPGGATETEFVNIDFVIAQEVFYGPKEIEVEIRSGYQTTALYVNLASKVNTKVKIELSNPELVVSNERLDSYYLYQGTQQTLNFVAFGAHSGTITVLNENDEVLATVPYSVRFESSFRHAINGSVNTSGNISLSYSLSSPQGWSVGAGVGMDSNGSIGGSVSGSYSW